MTDTFSATAATKPHGASTAATRKADGAIAGDGATPRDPNRLRRYLSLDQFERAAERHLPRMLYGYAASGTETDASIHQNASSYAKWSLVPRVLTGAASYDHSCTLFGQDYAAPFGISPMGASALFSYNADVAMARAAKEAGIPMVLSGASLTSMEEVAIRAPGTWFQAYIPHHPDQIRRLLERVAKAGYRTLVITVDVPVPGNREVDKENGFNVPLKLTPRLAWDGISHPSWLVGTALRTVALRGVPRLENYRAARGPSVLARADIRGGGAVEHMGWPEIRLARSLWKGKLVLKGILSAHDARRAREIGIDGIIISNHGGRQLDGAVAPLRVLPGIREAVPGMTVMIDGGIRRGTDVVKALALGADFAFIGRPFLYAVSVAGAAGLTRAINLMCEEIRRDMVLTGIARLSDLGTDFVLANE